MTIYSAKDMPGKYIFIAAKAAERKTVFRAQQQFAAGFQQYPNPFQQADGILCPLQNACCHNIMVFRILQPFFHHFNICFVYFDVFLCQCLIKDLTLRIPAGYKKHPCALFKVIPVEQGFRQIPNRLVPHALPATRIIFLYNAVFIPRS